MTSFFPDVNVWVALSVLGHSHNLGAWEWLDGVPPDASLVFSRFTQIGLLRLLTNQIVMGERTLTLERAWSAYDRWLGDPRVKFHPEPRYLDAAFRQTTEAFLGQPATKWIGDCYLLAFAKDSGATFVTYDKALLALARKQHCAAIIPS